MISRTLAFSSLAILLCLLAGASSVTCQEQAKVNATQNTAGQTTSGPETFRGEGIAIEFGVGALPSGQGKSVGPMAGADATVRFKISEMAGGKPLGNLRPVAWLDQRASAQPSDARECREKVQAFLQASFTKRPTIDLNSYFILALNDEPNISVIDPLSGFGGSKLLNLVPLSSAGADWLMSADKKRLYVSMPEVNQVAVIDTVSWKPIANVDAGVRPTRLALQHDGRYLWIGNDGSLEKDSGITVVDTQTLKVAAQLSTGSGHHEIAFNDDDSLAFVTNKQDGTLALIDMRKFARNQEIKVGSLPTSVAYSALGGTVYVANEGDGTIVALGGAGFEIVARMKAQPGLRSIRLPADSRFGFAINPVTNSVSVFDLSANKLVHTVPVGPGADQIMFTKQFAYVRASGNEFVSMIKLADLGKEAALSRFPAGEKAPKESSASSFADALVPAPEEGAVLVANPADKMIYYYMEGMAAPMGSFQNYRRAPKALLVLDNGLRESALGIYSTTARLAGAGHYDAVLLLDSPRVVHCFDFTVAENPALPKQSAMILKLERLSKETPAAGQSYTLRFSLTDGNAAGSKVVVDDLGVLVFLAPGIWQKRELAKPLGDGSYEISFVPPEAGAYYVFVQSPSLKIQFSKTMPLTLDVAQKPPKPN